MNLDEIKSVLEKELKKGRYLHSLGVMQTAKHLAVLHGESKEQAKLAGLLHDCARVYEDGELAAQAASEGIPIDEVEAAAPLLLHAPLGAVLAEKRFGITDAAVLEAIRLHTTGGRKMTKLDKIIYLADMIEPHRSYPEVDALRKMAVKDLDGALLQAFNQSIQFVIGKNKPLHLDTIAARNELLFSRK